MITGFNTNVRHRGRMFHVQTEDSGREHPHVISHVYFRGTILASEKREYAELLGRPDLTSQVRRLMDEQHRAMVERLKSGELDAAIAERLGEEPSRSPPAAKPAPRNAAERPRSEPEAHEGGPPPRPAAPAQPQAAADPSVESAVTARPRAFGEGIVSEKPLDEVILDYLVEKARSRSTEPAARPGRRTPE
jgi:hypothetical protein